MQRIDGPTRSAALPAPRATGSGSSTPGFFTRGDPIGGVPPTTVDADWLNMLQEEIMGVVEHAGLQPDKADHGQLLAALLRTFVSATDGAGVVEKNGEITIPLPGGFYLKLGMTPIGNGANSVTGAIAFVTPFAGSCVFLGGNADGTANGQWGPIVIMIGSPSKSGAPFTADTANQGQQIAAGRNIRWLAVGN